MVGCLLLPITLTNANPAGGQVTHGQASFNQQGKTLNITNTPGTIINWQDFSIASDETTRFIQQNRDSAVLNRISGQNPSSILGTLQSNGQVYLINPNGIVFGQNAQINVAGLVASTLNMTDADFLNGRMNFAGNNDALLQNFGIIETSDGGDIFLIGNDVENHGIIKTSSGNILLAAGESVSIVDSTSPEIEVQITAPDNKTLNVGNIITQNGSAGIYAGLIEHQGIIKASTAVIEGGRIVLKAKHGIHLKENSVLNADGNTGGNITVQSNQGETRIDGNISAQGTQGQGGKVHVLGEYVGLTDTAKINASGQTDGGTILIGGDNKGQNANIQNAKGTYIALGSEIHADAVNEGDGGTVIVWSDDATRAYGTITAKGGSSSGDGGFVETSGGYLDVANIDINVTSNNGQGGSWLLDPYDITIGSVDSFISSSGTDPITYIGTVTSSSTIANTTINAQLNAGTSVIVDTTSGGGDAGDITVSQAVSKTAGGNATLTLNAHDDIFINNTINSTSGKLNLVLNADQDDSGAGNVTVSQSITSNNGKLRIYGNDVAINAAINSGSADVYLAPSILAPISIAGSQNFDLTQNDITNITAGTIYIGSTDSPGSVYATTVDIGSLAAVDVASRTLRIQHSGNLTLGANNFAATGGYLYFLGASASDAFTSGSGLLSATATELINYENISIGVGGITTTGNTSLKSDIISIGGSINAVDVHLYPKSGAISLGGSETFNITQSDLLNIFASGVIKITGTTTADISSVAPVDIGAKELLVIAGDSLTIGANSFSANGGSIKLENYNAGADITTSTGNITSGTVTMASKDLITIGGGGITTTGNMSLRSTDLDIGGALNAGSNNVYLYPYTLGTATSIGGAQTFNLTQADLTNITSGMTYVGQDSAGTVYASTVDLANVSAVNIGNRKITVKGTGNITGGNNSFSSGGGSSSMSIVSSSGGSITTGTGTLISDTMTLDSANNLTIGTGGLSVTGGMNLSAASNITQSGNIVTSGAGAISFNTAGGSIFMGSTNNTSTNGGNITYSANGNVSLGRLYTGTSAGTVSVTSTTGSISDSGYSGENIYASVANLTASTSIGGGGFDVFFNNLGVTNLNATSSSGGININSTSAVNVGNVNSGTGTINLTTSGGSSYLTTIGSTITGAGVSLNSSQNLTIGAGGINSAGNMSLTAAGTLFQGGNISTTAGGAILAIANSATFNNITSAGNIGIETDAITITNPINAGTNNVYIMPRNNNAISIDGVATFNLTQGELNNITAGNLHIGSNGGTTTRATTASISTNASTTIGNTKTAIRTLNGITFGANNFTATGADIGFKTVNAGSNITTGAGLLTADILDLVAPGTVSVGSGGITTTTDIAITAGGAALNGTVTTPALYLEPFAAATAISVGGSRPFDINQTDINNIAATTTYIGNNSFLQNANNANLATASAIDFGARNIIIDADNGIQTGAFTLAATGGNLTLVSRNVGFDITTNAGNLAANNLTLTSARDIIIGAGGLSVANSITGAAANNINQNGNITCGGPGNITLNATSQNITMSAGTVTNSGSGNINYTAGGDITLALLNSNGTNTTLNATGNIFDVNGNGVNNVNANILTVSSGGNASLDYAVTGGVNSAGVVGTADLRDMNAGGTTTTTTTTATTTGTTTTTEATNTIIETITATTSGTTATTSPGDTLVEQTDTGSEEEKEGEETHLASTETKDDKPKTLTKKNLRTCN